MTRGLMIAAPRSGSGKTTATLGLLRAFKRRGVDVVGLKSGPDYIDPAFHAAASGREGVNLNSWAMAPKLLAALAARAAGQSALALCEASMGLFDGVPARPGAPAHRPMWRRRSACRSCWSSTSPVKRSRRRRSSRAAQPMTSGSRSPACIVNRVGSERHRRLVVEAIEAMGISVVGALPRNEKVTLPERHLGLVQAGETEALEARLDAIADFIEAHVDCGRVLALAGALDWRLAAREPIAVRPPGQRIALARDAAFSFIYPHLVQGWRIAGAEIVPFSPLADEPPPSDCDVCWLPGGYPELHAGRLGAAARFLDGLRHFAETRPVHGECGGYMALGESLVDAAGVAHPMAGLLSVETSFEQRRMTLGYREARVASDCALGAAGSVLCGHEFHYATIVASGSDDPFAFVRDVYGAPEAPSGLRRGRVTGSFFHVIAEA